MTVRSSLPLRARTALSRNALVLSVLALAPVLACAQAEPLESSKAAFAAAWDAAGQPRIGLHLFSHHWPAHRHNGTGPEWNNVNPGVSLRWANGITAGVFRNSYARTSAYAGWTWTASACGPALAVGIATGYREDGKLRPTLMPSLCVFDHYRFYAQPKFGSDGVSMVHMAVEF